MTEKPWDWGTWTCEACGTEIPGERAEPPLDHVHSCEQGTSHDLTFEASEE